MADPVPLGHRAVDDPRRHGPLLSGVTALEAAVQLLDLVVGPKHPARPAIEYLLGLDKENPPPTGGRSAHTQRQADWLIGRIRAQGRLVQLRPQVWPELSVRTADLAETTQRRRIAALLSLPPPVPAGSKPTWWSGQLARAVTAGVRALTAVGGLYFDDVAAAAARSHLRRTDPPTSGDRLAAALFMSGARIRSSDGRWTYSAAPRPKDAALLAAARSTGRHRHTHRQVADLLVQAGYRPASTKATTAHHPLIDRIAPDRYRILGVEGEASPANVDQMS